MKKLEDCLTGKPYLHIFDVYHALRGKAWQGPERLCQQRLGWTVTRYNRLGRHRVVPGPEVYTYTLVKG
jgi:hypothetical protein